MLDLRFIRENPDIVRKAAENKGEKVDLERLLDLDEQRRTLIQKNDALKAQRNRVSEEIGRLKKEGKNAADAIADMKRVGDQIKNLDDELRTVEEGIRDVQAWIPNIPHASVPVGPDARSNEIIKEWGEIQTFDFKVQPHWEIGPELGLVDFNRGAQLSGANFVAFAGAGARLARALINFMLDLHVEKQGYTEVSVPFIVKRDVVFGVGQLPKMEDDMYLVEREDLFLISTAEVPVTNLHRDEMLQGEDLPSGTRHIRLASAGRPALTVRIRVG